MKKFKIETTEYEKRVTERVYIVEADSEDEALEKVSNNEVNPDSVDVGNIEYDTGGRNCFF